MTGAAKGNGMSELSTQVRSGALAPGGSPQLPAYLQAASDMAQLGKEQTADYFVPPRAKVIQSQTAGELRSIFGEGAVVAMPHGIPIAPGIDPGQKEGPGFTFVPIFFFPEWALVNPYELRGQLPQMIRERTTDRASDIARRARDPQLREVPCPENDKYKLRYVEFLNFLVLIDGHSELSGVPVLLSFSRAGHRDGSTLSGLITMRPAAMPACRFEARATPRKNQINSWYGLTVGNPRNPEAMPPFVQDEAEFRRNVELHHRMAAMFKTNSIKPDLESDFGDDIPTPGEVLETTARQSEF